MPRGLSAPIKTELGQTTLAAPIYCVRIRRSGSGETFLRYAERQVTFNDGTGVQTFGARLKMFSSFDFSADEAGPLTITLANIDGLITALDHDQSFAGGSCELLAYLPGLDTFYIPWAGYCDEIVEMDAETATLQANPAITNPHVQLPQRTVGIPCTHVFANTNTWVNAKDFEGSECPYQRVSTVGFTATLQTGISASPTSFTIDWSGINHTAGAAFKKGHTILIDVEKMLIVNNPAFVGDSQALTVQRGYAGTVPQPHSTGALITFASCFYDTLDCGRHGMYGNNPADTYSGGTKKRNYFGGFPFITGWQYGNFRSKAGERARELRMVFSGNESAYGRVLPLVYGRVLISDPILLIAKPEGDFLTTLWLVAEGLLATNANDDGQTTPGDAYVKTSGVENIYVNGVSRHDARPGYGIEVVNGEQDRSEPAAVFFPAGSGQIDDFVSKNLGFWGSARVTFRINTKNNPSVDVQGQSITGSMEIAYGRIVRVYSDATTFTRKASTNPAWVWMDVMTAKRAGGGLDHARLNIQSFLDVAAHAVENITSTYDGSTVPRWTFNGTIDARQSYSEWIHRIALGCYSLPPFVDKDGKLKVKALKVETLTGLPVFSSKAASTATRNILWENGHSGLVKSHRPIAEIPNEIRVNYVDLDKKVRFAATLRSNLNSVTDPVTFTGRWALADVALGAHFQQNDVILIDAEQMRVTNFPAAPDGSGDQSITCTRAFGGTAKQAHTIGAIIQFKVEHARVSVTIADRESQTDLGIKIGDTSRRAITKSIDLPGTSTLDEAARLGTLLLRAGEFGQGGLANNLKVVFGASYRDAEDLESGDIIEVEDDQLNAAEGEQYFRVTRITNQPLTMSDGTGFVFTKTIEAVLHANEMYDDTAFTVSKYDRLDAANPSDMEPPAVTAFGVAENGIFDTNNKLMTSLTFTYTEPDPKDNFKSVALHVTEDDGAGNPVENAWRYIGDLLGSGEVIKNFEITNTRRHFCAASRALSGHAADVGTLTAAGTFKYPRASAIIDGMTDVLPAPTGFQLFLGSGLVTLRWLAYTGNNLKLFKTFHLYRNTVNVFASATLLATNDGTLFIDATVAASTLYYYWVVGVSVLNVEGTPTGSLNTTSPADAGADTAVPDVPTIGVIRALGSFNANEYTWTIGIDRPGGAANWSGIAGTHIQVATDTGFTSLILDYEYAFRPPFTVDVKVTQPGTYHFRALVRNALGPSSYTGILTRTTNMTDVAGDTALMAAPSDLAMYKTADAGHGHLAGNQFEMEFSVPAAQAASYWGYSVIVHTSPTLPTATTFDTGIAGAISSGNPTLTDFSKGFTVNALVGKHLVVFSTKRAAIPSWDYEGVLYIAPILSNTATTITMDIPSQRVSHTMSSVKYYVVNPGNHFYEKIAFSVVITNEGVTALSDQRTGKRRVLIQAGSPTVYGWVALNNMWGSGMVGTAVTKTFDGITTNEIKLLAVTNAQIANNTIKAAKIDVTDLFAQTITASGTITGATLQNTTASANKIKFDATSLTVTDSLSSEWFKIQPGTIGVAVYVSNLRMHPNISGALLIAGRTNAVNDVSIYTADGSVIADRSMIYLKHGAAGTGQIELTTNNAIRGYVKNTGIELNGTVDFTVPNGRGVKNASGNAATAYPSGAVEHYAQSIAQMQIDNGSSSTQTGILILGDGSLRRVLIDNSDLGTGAKRYLYLG